MGANLFCDQSQGVCIEKTTPIASGDDAGTSGGTACTTNDECTTLNGNRPAVCRAGSCLDLVTDACPSISGAWHDPKAIIAATFFDKASNDPGVALDHLRDESQIDLAFSELQAATGGVPDPNGGSRPLVALHCNLSDAAYDQAASKVGVPVAFVGQEWFGAKWFADYGGKKGITTFCPRCLSEFRKVTAGSGDQSLVWQGMPPLTSITPLAALKVKDQEAKIRAARGLADDAQIKVALVVNSYVSMQQYADKIATDIRFNNKTTAENGSNYVRIQYGDTVQTPDVNFTTYIDQIVAAQPDIVVFATLQETAVTLIPAIEQKWGDAKPRPEYLMNSAAYTAAAVPVLAPNANGVRQRAIGVSPMPKGLASPNLQAKIAYFAGRYMSAFPNQTSFPPVALAYDDAYAIAIAIRASGVAGNTLTGADVARGMANMKDDQQLSVFNTGPSDVVDAFQALSSSQVINVNGLGAGLDFDSNSGADPGFAFAYCVGPTGPSTMGLRPAQVYFSAAQITPYDCP